MVSLVLSERPAEKKVFFVHKVSFLSRVKGQNPNSAEPQTRRAPTPRPVLVKSGTRGWFAPWAEEGAVWGGEGNSGILRRFDAGKMSGGWMDFRGFDEWGRGTGSWSLGRKFFLSWSGQKQHSIRDSQPRGRVGLDVDLYFTFYWDYGRVSEILENTDTFLSLCIAKMGRSWTVLNQRI